MNPFDAIALLVLVLAVVAGVRTGALPQVGGIAGAAIGLIIALNLTPWLIQVAGDLEPLPRAIAVLGGILGAVVLGEWLGLGAGARARRAASGRACCRAWTAPPGRRSGPPRRCSSCGSRAASSCSVRSPSCPRRHRPPPRSPRSTRCCPRPPRSSARSPSPSTTRACPTCSSASSRSRSSPSTPRPTPRRRGSPPRRPRRRRGSRPGPATARSTGRRSSSRRATS